MRTRFLLGAATLALSMAAAACGGSGAAGGSGLSGTIQIDGSSTVFPVSEAIAEEFQAEHPGVRVTVGQSGTGGGFEKFCNGETEISDASRPIKDEERQACTAKGIEPIEMQVAIDGLTVAVNSANTFVQCITTDQLATMWKPGATVKTWKDVNPAWPAETIQFFSPGADSGTFDYFTDEIVGEEGAMRQGPEVQTSEDDNILVQGIAGNQYAIGYFGYAYFDENRDKLKALKVDGGSGCVEPTDQTIEDGTYSPLSRPLFIYPARGAIERPEVEAFLTFYLDNVNSIVGDVGYIPAPADKLAEARSALA